MSLDEQLGLASSAPNAATLGRLLARLDGDALDAAVGAWLARYSADPVGAASSPNRPAGAQCSYAGAARLVHVNGSSIQ